MDKFDDYKTFAAHLIESGWIKEGSERFVQESLAAFENTQRRRGSEAARKAMNKAVERAW